MAKKSAGFFDLHAEKLTLGLCVVLVAGAAVYSLGGGRFAVSENGPAELMQTVGEAADQARQAVQNARPAPEAKSSKIDPAKDPVKLMQKWYGDSAEGLLKIAQVEAVLSRAQQFPPAHVLISGDSSESRRSLAQIVSPDIPIVIAGDPVEMTFPPEKQTLEEYDGRDPGANSKKVRRPYISVGAQVDLVDQDANFRTENYPEGSYLEVVEVHLQRKDLNDPRRGWEVVNTYLPFRWGARPKLVDRGGGSFKFEGVDSFRRLIGTAAEAICRPKLPSGSAQLVPLPYLDEPPKRPGSLSDDTGRDAEGRVKKWTAKAKDAVAGKRPFKDPNLDAAYILSRAAAAAQGAPAKSTETAKSLMQDVLKKLPKERRSLAKRILHPPEGLMPIVAHDLDAQPGHNYVYRIRYEAFNVYAGNPGELANPDDARRLTVFSGWSPETRPVEVTGDTYFYLTKADEKKGEATVTVFKVGRRGTEKQDYRVRIGDEIGRKEKRGTKGDFSTNAVCVDLDFDRLVNGKKDVALIYVDTVDGILRERILTVDKRDKTFIKLNEDRSASSR